MLDAIIWLKNGIYPGADPEILKKRALFTGHWMVDKKFYVSDGLKRPK